MRDIIIPILALAIMLISIVQYIQAKENKEATNEQLCELLRYQAVSTKEEVNWYLNNCNNELLNN